MRSKIDANVNDVPIDINDTAKKLELYDRLS